MLTIDQWFMLVGNIAAMVAAVMTFVNQRHIRTLVHNTNSMKDDLVAAVKSEATAAGITVGREVEKTAQKARDDTRNR
jgi:hypothetical protein